MKELENIKNIVKNYPDFLNVLEKINSANIRYGLYAGSHVAVLTSNRVPTDIDILVADDDFAKLKKTFPDALIEEDDECSFLYPNKDKSIEFMAFANVYINDSKYKFRLTDLCFDNSVILRGENFKIRMLNEVDTVLLKAMLQRGKELGKHDLEDIKDVLKIKMVDKVYLKNRLEEVNSDDRLINILKEFNLL